MSRLIVKNLPTYVTPLRLQEHFEQKGGPGGTVTDAKVALKPDGTPRRFGFIGYKTEREALAAKEWFDRTFIDSTRINVNIVEGAKDAPVPRPNKRPRLGPSPANGPVVVTLPTSTTIAKDPATSKSDAQLDEFMKVMQPRAKKGPAWANDAQSEQPVATLLEPNVSEDVAMADDKSAGAPKEEGISDVDWMTRRMTRTVDVVEKVFEQSDDEDEERKTSDRSRNPETAQTTTEPELPKDPTKETILQTARLFVRNLAFSCTDAELLELFRPFGEISQVHIPVDALTKQPKGVAYVTFAQATSALAAYEALDRKSFQGRLIHILAAVDRKGKVQVEEGEGRKKTVKDDKAGKRKAMAGKEFNWSMLYMNSDAVASSVADRLNIDKASILNPETGDNAAVKLALAETHIIQETKAYLESQGVLLSSFSSRSRSDTTILVKNIPYGTNEDQIREMFEPHGDLSRVLVPPAGTMAVVEFEKPDEAAKAFRAVAYRRLGNSVIYLEKGPLGMFEEGAVPGPSSYALPTGSALCGVKIAEQELGDVTAPVEGEEEEPSVTGGTTLYVKNLAFSTTQERLEKMFRHLPSFAFARVQTKPDPKRPDAPRLSMGYGFVGFKDVEGAKKALSSMQNFVLDGHALHVKFAGRGVEEEGKGKNAVKSSSRTTKMIVKNVPFEASRKDIQALFGSHGHLKSVRLPKKFDSRTRGFAFLDFVSRAEAENAYAALRHTHLLGRHLVLEWAEEAEQDLDVLRKKAGVGYGEGKMIPGRKRKLDLGKTGEEDVEDLEV
ncbi:Multiple RNA-binding domain-containing protein 1 [Hypsizygus marmoreus]|uniref:Multiple RNA-binding domain-containing protein 1 n=1 Tax=Hypsizygus marmoreus TaxID=39966 RepID=A0A369J8H1_HYPMA|nr:Multiple RNA-binding domain-containing protein 1 [Hypsizygus marmoreus]